MWAVDYERIINYDWPYQSDQSDLICRVSGGKLDLSLKKHLDWFFNILGTEHAQK